MTNVTLHCPRCRGTEWETKSARPQASEAVKCAKCGHRSTMEKLAGDWAQKEIHSVLKRAFAGNKFITLR